jgi:glycine hydroxymethyltransferase
MILTKDPFEYCDMVTSTTHKSLRGPRAGMIFSKKMKLKDSDQLVCDSVDFAVFPMIQGKK